MKRILVILVLFSTTIALSQKKTFEKEVSKISKNIERITKSEKDSLKIKVVAIDKRLEKGEITKTTSTTLKQELAAYHARRIEKLVGEQEHLLQLLVQNKANGKIASNDNALNNDEINSITIGKIIHLKIKKGEREEREKRRKRKWKEKNKNQRSTTSQFIFAMGVNNVLKDDDLNSLKDSEYQFWRSRFYEVGFSWKTRFNKQPSKLYFKYGLSFLWNNLRLKDNQQHVINNGITTLETRIDEELTESRLRHVQMNFPLHLEWDFSKNKVYDNGLVKDRTNESVRFGIGGFLGFKLGTRQYLEYKNINGVDIEEVQYNNFNMNTINYGISAYLGYESISFYAKYDLNPLFKNTKTRNISMGIRLDLD